MSDNRVLRWQTPTLALAVLAIFGQAVSFNLIDTWDDSLYFLTRPEVVDWFGASWRQRLLTPELGYPVPLPTFVYFLVRQAPADLVVPLAHGLNVGLHLFNTLCALALARRWMEGDWLPWLVAAVWALHPLMAEPVAWVTNLKFLSMGAFSLVGLYVWERHLDAGPDTGWRWGLAAVACLVGGLACQPQALSIGPALVAMTLLHGETGCWQSKRVWGPIVLMALISMAYLPLAVSGQHEALRAANAADVYTFPLWQRLTRAGAAFYLQAKHTVWPGELHPAYFPRTPYIEFVGTIGLGMIAVTAIFTMLAVWKRHRIAWPLALAWAFYLPVSGIDFMPRLTADPYMYLPLFGIVMAAAMAIGPVAELWRRRFKVLVPTLVAVVIVVEAGMAFIQVRRWQSAVTLIEPTLEAYPRWPFGFAVLANAYARADEPKRAIAVSEKGLEVMYEFGSLPPALPRLYEESGRPAKAANILIMMLTNGYPGDRVPHAEAELLRVVVTHELPITVGDTQTKLVRRLLARSIEDSADFQPARWLVEAARYLAGQGEFELAQAALEAAARAEAEDCLWWFHSRQLAGEVPRLRLPKESRGCARP